MTFAPRFLRTMLAALAAMMLVPAMASAAMVAFKVGQTAMIFEAENGYCPLDESQTFDRNWLAIQRQSNVKMNEVAGAYALCNELAQLRQGAQVAMSRWIILLAPVQDGNTATPLAGYSRGQFLDAMEQEFANGIDLDVDEMASKVTDAMRDTAKNDALDPVTLSADNELTRLGRSKNGVFGGISMQVAMGSYNQRVACVMGMTLVKNHMVTVNVYRNYDTPETMNLLLAEADGMVDRLVTANKL